MSYPHYSTECGEYHGLVRDFGGAIPRIVCLCGSTRFYDEFQQANYDLTMQGAIVLSVGFYPHAKAQHGHGEGVGHNSAEKVALDELQAEDRPRRLGAGRVGRERLLRTIHGQRDRLRRGARQACPVRRGSSAQAGMERESPAAEDVMIRARLYAVAALGALMFAAGLTLVIAAAA